jgi:nicotinamidase-related amidase
MVKKNNIIFNNKNEDYKTYMEIVISHLQIQDISFTKNDTLIIIDMQRDFIPNTHENGSISTFGVANSDIIIPEISKLTTRFLSRDNGYVIASRDYHPANHVSFLENKGPFPSHCVQGTPGSEIVPMISRALLTSGKNKPKEKHKHVEIVFKGFDTNTDSFSAVKYADNNSSNKIQQKNRGVCKHAHFCSIHSGSFNIPVSGHKVIDQTKLFGPGGHMSGTGNINAPPDIVFTRSKKQMEESRLENMKFIKKSKHIFIVGVALDFCVIDTAINLTQKIGKKVYIILDMCRPAFIHGDGYLTPPLQLVQMLKKYNIKIIKMSNIKKLPPLKQKYMSFYQKYK